jgi:hypothetical protein
VGCTFGGAGPLVPLEASSTSTPAPETTAATEPTPGAEATASTEGDQSEATPASTGAGSIPVTSNALYGDNFTDPTTGWPEGKFDNYFIGYHEPEYYHIEIESPNYKTTVFAPEKQNFGDVTLELKVQVYSSKTAGEGDFIYGPAFRRSGDQYYAFAISTRDKKWFVLKSSPDKLATLAEGSDASIHDLDANDALRVDLQGSTFYLHINGRLVGQVSDPDYSSGEIGFYVQSFDSPQTHIHFDELAVRNFEAPEASRPQSEPIYHDDLSDPATGWAEAKFDNYFIGYHEPTYYHVEIGSPNYKTNVFTPEKQSFGDTTLEVKAAAYSSKTAGEGDFIYGPAFRRSGDQYYAFAISTRDKKWFMLKSAPSGLTTLAEGTDASIHDLDANDALRVDMQGSTFYLHINGRLVGQVTDPDYASGEIGFYVQSFDSPQTHIHFDELTVWGFEAPGMCTIATSAKLNVRGGPGTNFPASFSLSKGDTVEPLGHSPDGEWIKIGLQEREDQGWIANSPDFVTCNTDINALPVIIE